MAKSKWIAAALVASAAMLSTAAQAVTASVYVQVAPPVASHVWVDGYWVHERPPGLAYHPVEYPYARHWNSYRSADRYRHRSPDRDRDGIPDYRDRDLDNDGRPNERDRDRDGDGIRNRYDREPDNRYRY